MSTTESKSEEQDQQDQQDQQNQHDQQDQQDQLSNEPEEKPVNRHVYINYDPLNPPDTQQPMVEYRPQYVNLPVLDLGDLKQRPNLSPSHRGPLREGFKKYHSESFVSTSELKSRLKKEECAQCNELLQLVALWQLGVTGLASNYSRILAQLDKSKEAALKLDSMMRDRGRARSNNVPSSRSSTSDVDSVVAGSAARNPVAGKPNGASTKQKVKEDPMLFTSSYIKTFHSLVSHLNAAVDLCQQSAASTLKSNMDNSPITQVEIPLFKKRSKFLAQKSSSTATSFSPTHAASKGKAPPLLRGMSTPNLDSNSKPLESISEHESTASSSKDAVASSSRLEGEAEENGDQTDGAKTEQPSEIRLERLTSPAANSDGSAEDEDAPVPYKSRMLSLMKKDDSFVLVPLDEGAADSSSQQASPTSSLYTNNDVKQVMSKIADLEDDRLKLLEQVDSLQKDNEDVRLSLYETLSDLENKDLQLTLAMQDLSTATDEITRAAEMRSRLKGLKSERDLLIEKLSNLEDESSAVKISLVQLLQEKSATNKSLALEINRLQQKIVTTPADLSRRMSDDNISVLSAATTTSDADGMSMLMALDGNCYVHKQGFLIKQGGRVKSWKKRLFVLDSEGLSYYKTEQPIHRVLLSSIRKIQVCHHRLPGQMPNLFEIHTPDRIFYVSAPTKDEMQSWIGMLQTLKHHIHIRQSNSGSASASAGGGGASASASGSVSEESASRSPSSSPGALKKGSSRPVSSIRLGLKTVPMKSREAQTLPGYTSPTDPSVSVSSMMVQMQDSDDSEDDMLDHKTYSKSLSAAHNLHLN